MSKIYFVPDVHLQEQSPRSRKDAYPTTVLEKLDYIFISFLRAQYFDLLKSTPFG